MSQWTHVAGVVRIDALIMDIPDMEEPTKEFDGFYAGALTHDGMVAKVQKCFGNTVSYGDPHEKWDACTVPCGREGSLKYSISHVDDTCHLAWGVVTIWGDLRNYDSPDEIFAWLKKATEKLSIRQMAVVIDVESVGTWFITMQDDSPHMRQVGKEQSCS